MASLTMRRYNLIPGPRGNWLLGNLPDLRRDRLGFALDTATRFGDVARIRILNFPFYLVSHPDGIQHVLQDNNRNYHKGTTDLSTLQLVLGHGLLTNEDEPWLKQRRLMQPAFHHRNIEPFAELMTRAALDLAERWQQEAAGEPVINVAAEMMQVTLRIVTEALFSARVDVPAVEIARDITVLLEDVVMRFDFPFYPDPTIPTPHNRRFRRALADLDQLIYGLIEERQKHPREVNDLLNLLLNARYSETGQPMPDKQLRDEVLTLFLAGHETTAVALSWTWYLLSQHPEIEQRLHEELARVLGGRTPTAADLPSLPYTRQILDETMRLYPPAWMLSRKSLQPDEICGYPIPANALVSISPYVMHRHPAYWEEPERFDPDRFSPERSAGRPRYAYFPFGGGPRQCIGKGLALMEAPLILATLAQRVRLRLAPGARIEPQPLVTLRPKYGVNMIVEAS